MTSSSSSKATAAAVGRPRSRAQVARHRALPDDVGKLLWSLAQVALFLRKSERTVQRMVACGDLECVRVGQTPWFRDEHIDAFLQRKTERRTGPLIAPTPPPAPRRNPRYS